MIITATKLDLTKEEIDLSKYINISINGIKIFAENKGIQLRCDGFIKVLPKYTNSIIVCEDK